MTLVGAMARTLFAARPKQGPGGRALAWEGHQRQAGRQPEGKWAKLWRLGPPPSPRTVPPGLRSTPGLGTKRTSHAQYLPFYKNREVADPLRYRGNRPSAALNAPRDPACSKKPSGKALASRDANERGSNQVVWLPW